MNQAAATIRHNLQSSIDLRQQLLADEVNLSVSNTAITH
jgi:hypothetical protein